MVIIPAILASSVQEYEDLMSEMKNLKYVERVQVDFVDEFFSNQTLPLAAVNVNKSEFKYDAHLMVDPEVVWEEIAMAKINGFSRVIVQLESLDDQPRLIVETKEVEKGLAVDLETSLEQLDANLLPLVDVVLLMSVQAGFGGQMFDHRVINKVKSLANLRDGSKSKFKICVDGGVEKNHLGMLEEAGVDEVAVGIRRLLSW